MAAIKDKTEVVNYIKSVDWAQYKTAYNNAYFDYWTGYGTKIPKMETLLLQLFSDDIQLAVESASLVGACVCHQCVYVTDAALPACDVMLYGLKTLDEAVKEELIYYILGFVSVISKEQTEPIWKQEIRKKIEDEKELFLKLTKSDNEEISERAEDVLKAL